MKLPFIQRTKPRPFHYTPMFDKEDGLPISQKLNKKVDSKFKFERKAQNNSLFVSNILKVVVPAAILAAIAYFCLIIVGK